MNYHICLWWGLSSANNGSRDRKILKGSLVTIASCMPTAAVGGAGGREGGRVTEPGEQQNHAE